MSKKKKLILWITVAVICLSALTAIVVLLLRPSFGHEHTLVSDREIPPSCTESGISQGSHCAECGAIIVAQEQIPAKGHKASVISGAQASCERDGQTDASVCEICNVVLTASETIPAIGHQIQEIEQKPPSCTVDGRTRGEECTVCGKLLSGGETLVATGHVSVKDVAIAATCKAVGYTEGTHCSTCLEVLIPQIELPRTEHSYVERVCTVCGNIAPSEGLVFLSGQDGTCKVTGIGTCADSIIVIPSVSPDGDAVTAVAARAFYNVRGVTSVILSEGITDVEGEAFGYSSVTEISLPETITSISPTAFSFCTALAVIRISENHPIYEVKSGCLILREERTVILGTSSAVIPADITRIAEYAFSGASIERVVLPEGVVSIGANAFTRCKGLREIQFPNTLVTIGENAFSECTALVRAVLPAGVTDIGCYAFWGCTSLVEITLSTKLSVLSDDAFAYTAITELVLPTGISGIGARCFMGCDQLSTVTLPSSLTEIGANAFNKCNALAAVNYLGTEASWKAMKIAAGNERLLSIPPKYSASAE